MDTMESKDVEANAEGGASLGKKAVRATMAIKVTRANKANKDEKEKRDGGGALVPKDSWATKVPRARNEGKRGKTRDRMATLVTMARKERRGGRANRARTANPAIWVRPALLRIRKCAPSSCNC